MNKEYYVYIYCDPRKPGKYSYGDLTLTYEPFYAGKGSLSRWKPNSHTDKRYSLFLRSKLKNIQVENVIVVMLKNQFDEQSAFANETKLITTIGRSDLKEGVLVNLTNGGEGTSGYTYTEKNRQALSKAMKGQGHPQTAATKKRIGDANRGRKFDKKHSKKMSIALTGRKMPRQTKEHRAKLSEAAKRRWARERAKNK